MVSTGSSMRILLVDDVQLERMQLAIRLKQLGHSVEVASSGREAMEVFARFDPELVLLDVTMPDIDGFEVAQELRKRYQQDWVPIIFLSSHDEPSMIAKGIDSGGDDYLIKPVDKLVLSSKLLAMQRIASMRRELKRTSAKLEELNLQLQHQANEDGLTKVFNRRFMDEKLGEMLTWHGRHNMPMSLILFDVDHFKLFNDNYGHIEGDRCLHTLAQAANKLFCRSGEFVGRYGGEEFVIMLSNTDQESARVAAERVQDAIEHIHYPHNFSPVASHVTLSQGVVTVTPNGSETLTEVYQGADQALYQAKSQGRNRYVQTVLGAG
ncbi:diguanylate cyclase [Vibrio sp. ABG19]|uniref:GGDEF domain-containing response regulator n=1 Tax=Vibrio sp. ABG19 TaxID=2817385 RepID=UPI00249F46BE|nr:diguanylate cyclase [Vibrio sp. ABG19]WGY44944.1 diguanylate cyclase [Vibrio sp. ABG19]